MGQSLSIIALIQIMGCVSMTNPLTDPRGVGVGGGVAGVTIQTVTKAIFDTSNEMRDTTIAKHGHEGITNVKIVRRNLRIIPNRWGFPREISFRFGELSHTGLLIRTADGTERIVEHAGFVSGKLKGIVVSTTDDIILINSKPSRKYQRVTWREINGDIQTYGEDFTGVVTLGELITYMEQRQGDYHFILRNCHKFQSDAREWLRLRDRNELLYHAQEKGMIALGGGGGAAVVGVEG